MIGTLSIKGFQSHEETFLLLSPGLNAIVGETDCGKSAILRACVWGRWNRPLGTSFVRNGETDCEVAFRVKQGDEWLWVIRERSGKANGYRIGNRSRGIADFPLAGRDVPQEVVDLLGLDPISVQRQFDLPYLLFSTPGQAAREINQYTHLDKGDELTSAIAKDISQLQSGAQEKKAELGQVEEEIAAFEWLAPCGRAVDSLERAAKEAIRVSEDADILEQQICRAARISKEISDQGRALQERSAQVRAAKKALGRYQEAEADVVACEKDVRGLERLLRQAVCAEDAIRSAPEVSRILGEVRRLSGALGKAEEGLAAVVGMLARGQNQVNRARSIGENIEGVEQDLRLLQERRNEFLAEIDVCPTCGRPM